MQVGGDTSALRLRQINSADTSRTPNILRLLVFRDETGDRLPRRQMRQAFLCLSPLSIQITPAVL